MLLFLVLCLLWYTILHIVLCCVVVFVRVRVGGLVCVFWLVFLVGGGWGVVWLDLCGGMVAGLVIVVLS
jgi:hypothetical protein